MKRILILACISCALSSEAIDFLTESEYIPSKGYVDELGFTNTATISLAYTNYVNATSGNVVRAVLGTGSNLFVLYNGSSFTGVIIRATTSMAVGSVETNFASSMQAPYGLFNTKAIVGYPWGIPTFYADSSVTMNNAIPVAYSDLVAGKIGNCNRNTSGYFETHDLSAPYNSAYSSIAGSSSFSINLWGYAATSSSQFGYNSLVRVQNEWKFAIGPVQNSEWITNMYFGWDVVNVQSDTITNQILGIWNMYSIVRNTANNTYTFYLNGESIGQRTNSSSFSTSGPLKFNDWQSGDGGYNLMDECTIWNTALSASDITSLYNAGTGRQATADESGLIGNWTFDSANTPVITEDKLQVHGSSYLRDGAKTDATSFMSNSLVTKLYVDNATNTSISTSVSTATNLAAIYTDNATNGAVQKSILLDVNITNMTYPQFGADAKAGTYGAAFGNSALASTYGAAFGHGAHAQSAGVAVGYEANGDGTGVAVGYEANGDGTGVAVGYGATGESYGVAVGLSSYAYDCGTALGHLSKGDVDGVAVGQGADGHNAGVSIGHGSYAPNAAVAVGIGSWSIAAGSAIGHDVKNSTAETLAIPDGAPVSNNHATTKFYVDSTTNNIPHNALSNLAWSVAGHTIDTSLNLSNNSIEYVRKIRTEFVVTDFEITGGTITEDGTYFYHTFNDNDNFVSTANLTFDILSVAGGGGGGADNGGGGGAGGTIYSAGVSISAGSYSIVVGQGGVGSPGAGTKGANGTDTTTDSIVADAIGGGGGGSWNTVAAADGGSGGGGANNPGDNSNVGGSGTVGQGNDGGNGAVDSETPYPGGGGGGAGQTGFGCTSGGPGGAGGTGLWYDISGVNTPYSGGGGGGSSASGGSGGVGGGGNGGSGTSATAGIDGTGGGGGGGGSRGAKGGNGIVIIRYAKSQLLASTNIVNIVNNNGSEIVLGNSITPIIISGSTIHADSILTSKDTTISNEFARKDYVDLGISGSSNHINIGVSGLSNYVDVGNLASSNYVDFGIAGLSNYVDSATNGVALAHRQWYVFAQIGGINNDVTLGSGVFCPSSLGLIPWNTTWRNRAGVYYNGITNAVVEFTVYVIGSDKNTTGLVAISSLVPSECRTNQYVYNATPTNWLCKQVVRCPVTQPWSFSLFNIAANITPGTANVSSIRYYLEPNE